MKLKGIVFSLAIIIIAAVLVAGYLPSNDRKDSAKANVSVAPVFAAPTQTQVAESKLELAPQKQEVPISWEIGDCGYGNRLEIKFTNLKRNETVKARIETDAGKYGVEFLSGEGNIKSGRVPFGWQNGWTESNVEIFANNISVNKTVIKKYCSTGGSSGEAKTHGSQNSDLPPISTATPVPTVVIMPIPTATLVIPIPTPIPTPTLIPTPTPIFDEFCG